MVKLTCHLKFETGYFHERPGVNNITFTCVIYNCGYCLQTLKQLMATLVNYVCKSFINLTPVT